MMSTKHLQAFVFRKTDSVVTKDVAPWTVVGGVPAKKISERTQKQYDYIPNEYWVPFV